MQIRQREAKDKKKLNSFIVLFGKSRSCFGSLSEVRARIRSVILLFHMAKSGFVGNENNPFKCTLHRHTRVNQLAAPEFGKDCFTGMASFPPKLSYSQQIQLDGEVLSPVYHFRCVWQSSSYWGGCWGCHSVENIEKWFSWQSHRRIQKVWRLVLLSPEEIDGEVIICSF